MHHGEEEAILASCYVQGALRPAILYMLLVRCFSKGGLVTHLNCR